MIFKLLDAYEQEIRNEDSFFKRIAKMNRKWQIFLGTMFAFLVIGVGLNIWLGEYRIAWIIYWLIFLGIMFVSSEIKEKERRKQYMSSMQTYNDRLDCLKNILTREEFSVCSGEKLLAVMQKIK